MIIASAPRIGVPGDLLDAGAVDIERAQHRRFVPRRFGTDSPQRIFLDMKGDLECGIIAPKADAMPFVIIGATGVWKTNAHRHFLVSVTSRSLISSSADDPSSRRNQDRFDRRRHADSGFETSRWTGWSIASPRACRRAAICPRSPHNPSRQDSFRPAEYS